MPRAFDLSANRYHGYRVARRVENDNDDGDDVRCTRMSFPYRATPFSRRRDDTPPPPPRSRAGSAAGLRPRILFGPSPRHAAGPIYLLLQRRRVPPIRRYHNGGLETNRALLPPRARQRRRATAIIIAIIIVLRVRPIRPIRVSTYIFIYSPFTNDGNPIASRQHLAY